MTSLLREAPGNRNRFVYRQIPAQLIFPGPRHLSRSKEVRLVKILQGHGDLRLMQKGSVGSGNSVLHLEDREAFREQRARPLQCHEAIGLHRQSLVELGRKSETY